MMSILAANVFNMSPNCKLRPLNATLFSLLERLIEIQVTFERRMFF